jgi:c-di-GMP-binding flagellar brake protein YcgR
MMEERRRSIRVKTMLFIQYSLDVQESKRWDITTVKDISETGLCIFTGRKFRSEETITLRLKIPSRPFDSIEVKGRVVGSSVSETGQAFITRIEFKDLNRETKTLFHEYVEWVIKNSDSK